MLRRPGIVIGVVIASFALAAMQRIAHADRVKDMTTISGVVDNDITGFGLVVGLDGTGDDTRSPAVKTALTKALKALGVTIDPTDLKAKNVAAVMLTAKLPAFARTGAKIDVTISSLGNAKSLAGGTLLQSTIKGPDGKVYAIAQGQLSVGGFSAGGDSGSTTKKNHVTVGVLPGGGTVQTNAPTPMPSKEIVYQLKDADFTTATNMKDAVNAALGSDLARVQDSGTVVVGIPPDQKSNVAGLMAKIEVVEVEIDLKAKVVIDEKTGTIVVGENVTLRPAAITFGSLTIEVSESPQVSQPEAIGGGGKTKVVPQTKISVDEQDHPMKVLKKATTVADVAAALGALGAKPRDLIPILRALKAAGSLRAELVTQ